MSSKEASSIRVSIHGSGKITISSLEQEEIEVLLGCRRGGFKWVERGSDGCL